MDLAKDILDIGAKVAHVPGLGAAFTLAIQIIQTVQLHKSNNARLQYLAHFIANHLLSIADCMDGRWDDAPARLKDLLDDFEAALNEVSKLVTKHSKSSRVIAFINAGDRERDITVLERKLDGIQRSILLLVGLNNSLEVTQIHTLGRETHAAILRLADNSQQNQIKIGFLRSGEIGSNTYTRDDILLGRKILRHRAFYHDGKYCLNITLQEAERRIDRRRVIVRTYQGHQDHKVKAFMTNLKTYRDYWDSSVLQLVGASSPKEAVPFEVYHLPDQMETFGDWIGRTLHSDPAGAVLGLYDMRTSVRDILDFQRLNSVKCTRRIFRQSLVTAQARGDRLHWTLVYAGDLVSKISKVEPAYKAFRALRWDPLVTNSDHSPERTLIASFMGGSSNWVENTRDLDAIIDTSMDLPNVASALFQNGYLGDCGEVVVPKKNIILGDVGYIDGDGYFVAVDNLHARLSKDGQSPAWSEIKLGDTGGIRINEKTTIVRPSGNIYSRYEFPVVEPKPTVDIGVEYKDLDQNHAWQLFQHSAREIISSNSLSVAPHDLKLIYSVENFLYLTLQKDEGTLSDDPGAGTAQQVPVQNSTASTSAPSSSHVQSGPPNAYIFQKGDAVHVLESGAPELAGKLRPSLEAEPSWIDEEDVWQSNSGKEQNTDVNMEYIKEYMVFYIQLPPGIATPYVTEVDDV